MKRLIIIMVLSIGFTIAPTQKSHAVIWVVVKAAIKKVIKALDLQVQRLQNKTIGLQNAQKALENTMSKLQLDQITDWVNKHKEQYTVYFDELHKVKDAISGYNKVKEIMQKQVQLVEEYKKAFNLFKQDKHFTPDEIGYMLKVYTGIVDESLKNMDQLFLIVNALSTEMTDGKRLQIINGVAMHIDETLNDLRDFNTQNVKLSLERAKDGQEIQTVKTLYGLQ
ncbi:MAG: conjugal transfer protein TraI [Ferruginibacter sp.]